jgi:hypothetical protein
MFIVDISAVYDLNGNGDDHMRQFVNKTFIQQKSLLLPLASSTNIFSESYVNDQSNIIDSFWYSHCSTLASRT